MHLMDEMGTPRKSKRQNYERKHNDQRKLISGAKRNWSDLNMEIKESH